MQRLHLLSIINQNVSWLAAFALREQFFIQFSAFYFEHNLDLRRGLGFAIIRLHFQRLKVTACDDEWMLPAKVATKVATKVSIFVRLLVKWSFNQSPFHVFPFFRCREQEEGEEAVVYEGNQQWEGYSMDLIEAISKILHFQYRFELVPDGEWLQASQRNENLVAFRFRREVRLIQQSHEAVGWPREASIRSGESLTTSNENRDEKMNLMQNQWWPRVCRLPLRPLLDICILLPRKIAVAPRKRREILR